MKAITLRNVPKALSDKIETEAQRSGKSLNKTVIDLLTQSLAEPKSKRQTYRDLDFLIGSWSQEEADEFDAFLREHRTIDEEIWK